MAITGRPRAITEDVLQKLEEAFSLGCTDVEACLLADISPSTLYNFQTENPDFLERKATLKSNPVLKARRVVLSAIETDSDLNTARWMIEKADGKAKQAIDVGGGEKPVEIVFSWDDGSEG